MFGEEEIDKLPDEVEDDGEEEEVEEGEVEKVAWWRQCLGDFRD